MWLWLFYALLFGGQKDEVYMQSESNGILLG